MSDKVVSFKLHDGREVLISKPTVERDLERVMHFHTHLPAELKNRLRYNVHNHEILATRLREIDGEHHWRLIAELEGQVIADGTLDRDPYGWTRHIGELRVIVGDEYEGMGVRQALCEELVLLAQEAGIERLQVVVPVERELYIHMLERLGFKREVVRKGLLKAIDGKLHDAVIMSQDLEEMWRHLEDDLHDMDISFSKWSGGV